MIGRSLVPPSGPTASKCGCETLLCPTLGCRGNILYIHTDCIIIILIISFIYISHETSFQRFDSFLRTVKRVFVRSSVFLPVCCNLHAVLQHLELLGPRPSVPPPLPSSFHIHSSPHSPSPTAATTPIYLIYGCGECVRHSRMHNISQV